MALSSPGVQVSVIDESFYTPAEPGTVPLIIVASEENKSNQTLHSLCDGELVSNYGRSHRSKLNTSISSRRSAMKTSRSI